ncbi:hypothetical protein T484DRAFT_1827078 [Baffinella frigidus]|nr:hypothetical protein T484DRAFT_1827078 [Cryptophyta sp. CCMP2293]
MYAPAEGSAGAAPAEGTAAAEGTTANRHPVLSAFPHRQGDQPTCGKGLRTEGIRPEHNLDEATQQRFVDYFARISKYPDAEAKACLARESGVTSQLVSKWFINARRRTSRAPWTAERRSLEEALYARADDDEMQPVFANKQQKLRGEPSAGTPNGRRRK